MNHEHDEQEVTYPYNHLAQCLWMIPTAIIGVLALILLMAGGAH